MEIAAWITGIALGTFVFGAACYFGSGYASVFTDGRRWAHVAVTPFIVFGFLAFFLPLYALSLIHIRLRKLMLSPEQYRAWWDAAHHPILDHPDPKDVCDEDPKPTGRKWLWHRCVHTIFRIDRRPAGNRLEKRNDWDLLNTYQGEEDWLTRVEFIKMCTDRIRDGEIAYALGVDGELAAITWYVEQRSSCQKEVCARVEFLPNSAALYGGRVLKKFRRRGLYQELLIGALIDAFERGISHVYTSVNVKNLPSLKAQQFVGFKPIATYGYRCVLGKVSKWQTLS